MEKENNNSGIYSEIGMLQTHFTYVKGNKVVILLLSWHIKEQTTLATIVQIKKAQKTLWKISNMLKSYI